MEEKELKTSPKQRVFIALIAIIMVGSIVASYIAIVLSNNDSSGSETGQIDTAKIAEYQQEYSEKVAELSELSRADFDQFVQYRSEVTAYNETAANEAGVAVRDLLEGTGRELTEGDKDYLAYYIGWCADESVFDSTFDSNTNPTAFKTVLNLNPSVYAQILGSSGEMIQGWEDGVIGMKLGGVREITIPGELAYKDTREICGGTYKPLKFIVMAVAKEGELGNLVDEMELTTLKLQAAQYGIDYEELIEAVGGVENSETSENTENAE